MSKYLLLLLCCVSLSCASSSKLSGWTFLGERTVNHALDRDEIRVGAHDGTYRQLKLFVSGRAVAFRDLEVHFANGTVQDVGLRASIPAGGESRVIDLDRQNRIIEKVVFLYNTERRRGRRAVVQLYGRH